MFVHTEHPQVLFKCYPHIFAWELNLSRVQVTVLKGSINKVAQKNPRALALKILLSKLKLSGDAGGYVFIFCKAAVFLVCQWWMSTWSHRKNALQERSKYEQKSHEQVRFYKSKLLMLQFLNLSIFHLHEPPVWKPNSSTDSILPWVWCCSKQTGLALLFSWIHMVGFSLMPWYYLLVYI